MSELQPRAVLWDMDGTLVDSREYHWRAWREALAAEGFSLSEAQFDATFGQRNDSILRSLLGDDLSDSEIARIGDGKEQSYRALVRAEGITLLPGAAAWLERLHIAGWRQAIASAAPRANVTAIVDALKIGNYFAALVSAEDVERGKPDPQVFLVGATRLGVRPARCVVVEDAPAGLEAARRAGMRRIGVRGSHTHLEADIVADRLDKLLPSAFDRLVEA